MRKRLYLAIFLSLFYLFIFGSRAMGQLEPDFCAEYLGTMNDNVEIGMSLTSDGHTLSGAYFYRRDLKDITLSGLYTSERDIVLEERVVSGESQGTFRLRFVEDDPRGPAGPRPLTSDILRGKWDKADGSANFPVFLRLDHGGPGKCQPRYSVAGASSDELVEKNVQGFYFAVLRGDKEEASKYVSFPLSFSLNKHPKTISSRGMFLRYYDQIFTKNFFDRIAKGIPHHMFANWQGIMIGDGAVWFDENGKARHLNN